MLRVVQLDSLTAIYHRKSGQTHLIEEPVPEILAALRSASGLPEILACLKLDDDSETRFALSAHLDELISIGLVTAL